MSINTVVGKPGIMIPTNPILVEMHPAINQEILTILLVLIWAVWGLIMIHYSQKKSQGRKDYIRSLNFSK
jgi:hypothetical protein